MLKLRAFVTVRLCDARALCEAGPPPPSDRCLTASTTLRRSGATACASWLHSTYSTCPSLSPLSTSHATVAGGTNKSVYSSGAGAGARKLEEETEDFTRPTVGLDLARAIQQARTAKGMKQKELATVSAQRMRGVMGVEV